MGKSKAPKAPDPLPAAQATAAANKEVAQYTTALDRPTQVDPYGMTTWTLRPGADPKNPRPGDWTQTTYLNAQQQALLQKEIGVQNQAFDLGRLSLQSAQGAGVGGQLSMAGKPTMEALKQPNLSAMTIPTYNKTGMAIPTLANQSFAPQQMQGANVALPQWRALSGQVPQAQQLQGQAPTWAGMQGNIPSWRASQMGLPQNYYNQFQNQLAGMQDIDTSSQQFQSQGDAVRDALYQQMTRFSDQRFTQEEDALRQRLVNQGFAVGSEGFNRELEAFRRAKDESYAGAQLQSVLAGGQEQSRIFADMLAGTQQNIGRRVSQSQLDLARMGGQQGAAAQIYGLGLGERQSAFDAAMAGRGQQFAESQFGFGADMASRQQQQQELLDYFQQQMAGRQQQFGEAQFGFDAGAQSYALDLQNRQAMQEGNLAAYQADLANRALGFDAGMSRYQADMTARQTNYANDMQRYQADLVRQQQMFQNQAQAEQWDAAVRSQLLQEQITRRQVPLNEALAMAGMSGVQGPAYQPFNLSNPWQPVDYLGVQNMQYQNQLNAANFQNAQRGQTYGLLGGLAMAGATAW